MAYSKGFFDLTGDGASSFPSELGLQNVGFSVYVLQAGEGWDYFHNHREQEEVYLCIEGTAEIVVAGKDAKNPQIERVPLAAGEAVKVDPETLRAIGNSSDARAVLVIAGGCPHPYPAGLGHDVIADVHRTVGHGETGFNRPSFLTHEPPGIEDDNC
ncbi:MAG: cupin domain-containing protein [Myxococcota bacterium]